MLSLYKAVTTWTFGGSAQCYRGNLSWWRITAGGVFCLRPDQRRVEDADQFEFRRRAQDMSVVLVESVDRPRCYIVNLASGFVLDAASAGDAIDGFEMMLIAHSNFEARFNFGHVQGKFHTVLGQEHASALAGG